MDVRASRTPRIDRDGIPAPDAPAPPGSVAIIGMSGRFPGAADIDALHDNIRQGADSISRYPVEDLELPPPAGDEGDRDLVCARGLLADVEQFDARFFGCLPREAELMDPQQRIFLEICWEALERGGYDAQRHAGAIGVFAGCFMNSYLLANLCGDPAVLAELVESLQTDALQIELGNDKDYLASRVAYKLGLRGPAMTLQTACSTSLVAVVSACQSLATGQCDMALAGGVTIVLPQKRGYRYREGSILARAGRGRPFDEAADGTVFSNGAAAVLLKRLDDAVADGDSIHAVIRGYALNNDGSRKVNYTAPSPAGQAEVITLALRHAEVDARTVGYVETHGTATPLGDPIEVAGLTSAYRGWTADNGYCAIGSVKANVGHLDVAAGVTGLIKAALVVEDGMLPPEIGFERPNPKIDFDGSPFRVNTVLRPWPATPWPRRAGVSAFGVGGTNAHVVLEQAPDIAQPRPGESAAVRRSRLFILSARTPGALQASAQRLDRCLATSPRLDIDDAAFTLQLGRREFDHRRFVVADDVAALRQRLQQPPAPGESGQVAALRPPVVFMFPGQGMQHPGMARELYETEAVFRDTIERCVACLEDDPESRLDLRRFLLWAPGAANAPEEQVALEMARTEVAQPALFSVGMALANLMRSWGVSPTAVIGHSVGEFAAAVVAGIFELEEALRIVAARGRLMQALPGGRMIAIRRPLAEVKSLLPASLCVAAENAPALSVVSGADEAIAELCLRLQADDVQYSELRTSHAFHSATMLPAVAPLVARIAQAKRRPPTIDFHSTVLGRLAQADEIVDPDYWGRQVLQPVLFARALQSAAGSGRRVLLEAGPRAALASFARQTLGSDGCLGVVPLQDPATTPGGGQAQVLAATGRLWLLGVTPEWQALHPAPRRRVRLPTYPFERRRYWVDPPAQRAAAAVLRRAAAQEAGDTEPDEVAAAGVAAATTDAASALAGVAGTAGRREQIVQRLTGLAARLSGLAARDLPPGTPFVQLGFDSLFLAELATACTAEFGIKITMRQLLQDDTGIGALADRLDSALPLPATASVASAAPIAVAPIVATAASEDAAAIDDAAATPDEAPTQVLPMTPGQRELWSASQMSELASCAFNESDIFRITGRLDADCLCAAIELAVARHEAFRLRFDADGLAQRLDPQADCPVRRLDFTAGAQAEQQLAALIDAQALEPFDLVAGPTARIQLARMSADCHVLLMYFHHIVFDGYSGGLLMREIAAAYQALRRGQPVPAALARPYGSYVRCLQQRIADRRAQEALDWWQAAIGQSPPQPLELPTDRPRRATRGHAGATVHREFAPALLEDLRALARARSVTLFNLLLAGFSALLSRLSMQDDVVIAIPAAGQAHLDVEAVGYCVNALPIRTQPLPSLPFSSLLSQTQQGVLDALDHQDVGIGEIARALRLGSSPDRLPLAEVMFNFSAFLAGFELEGCHVVAHENRRRATFYDLFLHIVESDGRLILDCDHATALYDGETIGRWLDHYQALLEAAVADPDCEIGELPLLSQDQQAALIEAWSEE